MTCSDLLDRVEAIAAGDVEPDAAMQAHLESCLGCRAALVAARRIDAALASLPVPHVPQQFTDTVVQRIRKEQWRAEERVDRLFNIGIAAALVLMIGGVAALLNVGGMLSMAGAARSLASMAGTRIASAAAATLGTYAAGAGLLLTAMGMWWWAERRLTL